MSRETRRHWLYWTALTWAGLLITVAGIVFGIWLQFDLPERGSFERTYLRLTLGLAALVPIGVGLLVIGAAQILAAMHARTAPPTFD